MVNLRRAESADAPAIHALKLAAFGPFRDQYTEGCFDATVLDAERIRQRIREGPVWVAETQTIVGTVAAVVQPRGLYVRGMAVHPEARGAGLGWDLLELAEAEARQQGITSMWLSTTTFLTGSQRLYERFGFVPASGPRDLFDTPLVSFEKRTSPS